MHRLILGSQKKIEIRIKKMRMTLLVVDALGLLRSYLLGRGWGIEGGRTAGTWQIQKTCCDRHGKSQGEEAAAGRDFREENTRVPKETETQWAVLSAKDID